MFVFISTSIIYVANIIETWTCDEGIIVYLHEIINNAKSKRTFEATIIVMWKTVVEINSIKNKGENHVVDKFINILLMNSEEIVIF